MPDKYDTSIALFIRDKKTRRRAFNAKALKALGVDPTEARERGYFLKEPEDHSHRAMAGIKR